MDPSRAGKPSGRDPLLYGHAQVAGIVAVECRGDEVVCFRRTGAETLPETDRLEPFLWAERAALATCPAPLRRAELTGSARLNALATFDSWSDWNKAKTWLAKATGKTASSPEAPYLCVNDPVQQYLMRTGRTLFLDMRFEDLRRLQVDIECETTEGYEFCHAEREGDRIVAIGLGMPDGRTEALSLQGADEKGLLERFVAAVREADPDVIEGHNVFNFDLPYLAERARRHGVKLSLGRDGSEPARRPSRLTMAERTLAYERFDIFGRHVVDTLFLVHAYDVSHRSLDGFGLKEAAAHFGLTAKDRTYVEGNRIGPVFRKDPGRVLRYVGDDVAETRGLSNLLSRSWFLQAQMLPFSYQNVCVRGTATKIDALLLREYLREGVSVPLPDEPRPFEGGYADVFVQGVVRDVHHCDVRSLYPSLMLTRRLAPRGDERGVFLRLLATLRDLRLEAKTRMQKSAGDAERTHADAFQATLKILINSFYGYLAFSQARFSDFAVAEQVTSQGRDLLQAMIAWLRKAGAKVIETDTDGIYFVPPEDARKDGKRRDAFRREFAKSLPEGIEVEFDGEYVSMYSYRTKNYALLSADGEMILKGGALKSRGLEPFQRKFLEQVVRLKLEERDREIPKLKETFEAAIRNREWPIEELAKTETLQDSPSSYAAGAGQKKRARSAAYELALRSGREYRAGDQISYYVTGTKKSVAVHENAKLVSEAKAAQRDENVVYYLAKLDALYEKLCGEAEAGGEQMEWV